jgi:hypothetical protein
MRALLIASEPLTRRLRTLQRKQMEIQLRGDTNVELPLQELFDPSDLEFIQEWERVRAQEVTSFAGTSREAGALVMAAGMLVRCLLVLQKLQMQCRERGETAIELHVAELSEAKDQQALDAWEKAKDEALGQQPLPMEISA